MKRQNRKALALHLHTMALSTLLLKQLEKRKKKWWVHPVWKERQTHGHYHALVKSLREQDPLYFKKFLRMTPHEFSELRKMVLPLLKKRPAGRRALSVGHRLAITLRYLASGDSMASISFAFRIGFSTASVIISEVCEALWKALKPKYLPVPTKEKWEEIGMNFWSRWQFPNCLGVVDGKHVQIQAPAKSSTKFYNYKGNFSTVLMAVVDSNYKFIIADIGGYGSNSDGGLWKSSKFGNAFDSGSVPIPEPKLLPRSDTLAPHVLLGDEAFQLRPNFLRPYPGKQLNDCRRIYNYRLSRARRCVENAFGILAARWRLFRRPILLKTENVVRVVKASIVLHNYLKTEAEKSDGSIYCPRGYGDSIDSNGQIVEGQWRQEVRLADSAFGPLAPTAVRNFSHDAHKIRESFVDFFNGVGSVEWQAESAGINEVYIHNS